MFNRQKFYRVFGHNSKGFSLIEVIVALALLGIIGVAFFGGLATASKAIFIADERATAESLARSQMEYVKNQDYTDAGSGEAPYDKMVIDPDEFPGYTIWSVNRDGDIVNGDDDDDIIGVPWDSDRDDDVPAPVDVGLQKITIVIYHHYDATHPDENIVIILENYKVNR